MHVFDKSRIDAVNAALATGRPLLVRGEPGIGKSQLARATAKLLGRAYIPFVVTSHTESRDLMWRFDAISRLAHAQLGAALGGDKDNLRRELALDNFIAPGPLWWAFDWNGARSQAARYLPSSHCDDEAKQVGNYLQPPQSDGGDHKQGAVVLIDEIDKAEMDIPNGLLEVLGKRCFLPEGFTERVYVEGVPPLIIITTNEERAMPDAFLRRCLALHLALPSLPGEREKFQEILVERGGHHLPDLDKTLLESAACLVAEDRIIAQNQHHRPLPGQAEYIDLLHAIHELAPGNPEAQQKKLEQVARYVVSKRRSDQG
uniref:AAA domain (Dynein-related subfamily) n=1 Tax=Candidatus Kentrum sp. TUN TaxID=2126343 RepID=A0A450ZIK6_9GAMM|nr:MAG: AAA domain (dynein-related subfamily) [Candidatus Kentron sp. TUN]VFK55156.1 MAG: AAA domain (dynein-related subfamily) [Candidatus Kentron sp. TUN]